MNPLFLLKLVADLLKTDKPSPEEIKCARTIVNNLVNEFEVKPNKVEVRNSESKEPTSYDPTLDDEAREAQEDLMNLD